MKSTIAIIATAHREGSGAYVVLDQLLGGWNGSREDLIVVSPPDSRAAETAARLGYRVVRLDTPRDALVWNVSRMLSVARQLAGCSLVHAWHSRGFELAWWLGRKLGVPSSATFHDAPDSVEYGVLRKHLIRFACRRLDGGVCVSHALAREWTPLQVLRRIGVVHNGLMDEACGAEPTRTVPVIGFLGMYASWKGFETVRDWVMQMGDTDCEWRFYGTPRESYGATIRDLLQARPGSVKFCGFQSPARIFAEIDILINPSSRFDPLPTTLIEAARCGLPAIASDLGGAREIIEQGVTGYVFDVAHPASGLQYLRDLVSDKPRRLAMGRAARGRYLERFGAGRMAVDYARFWDGLQRALPDRSVPVGSGS